jgi:NADH:ubiquinone oxidoreductase subunit 6 (subunit J)
MSGGDILYLENKQYLLISFSTMSLNISIREIKENAQSHLDGIWMKVAMVMLIYATVISTHHCRC